MLASWSTDLHVGVTHLVVDEVPVKSTSTAKYRVRFSGM